MRIIKYISITALIFCTCTSIRANNITDTIFTYFDGARNKYILKANELEYIPVNARESSSGIYNGGTYESTLITKKENKHLVELFEKAVKNKKAHSIKNIKPNAAVEISTTNKKISFLLISSSPINILLNNYLRKIIKNVRK